MNLKKYLRKKNQLIEETIGQKLGLRNTDEITNYLLEDIGQNKLMSRKHKKVCRTLNYIKHFLIIVSAVTGYISISTFASLLGTPIATTLPVIQLHICTITARIENYKSIINKKKEKS